MSKATEYAEWWKAHKGTFATVLANRAAVIAAAPEKFECDRISVSKRSVKVRASVQYDGSLEVSGWLPADKVADFVKWLGEVYGEV